MTGRDINKLGFQNGAIVPGDPTTLGQQFTLLPELLKEEGYATVGLGKWHLGFTHEADLPINRGFDKFFGNLQGAGDFYSHEIGLQCNSANPVNPDTLPITYGSNCYAINGYDMMEGNTPVLYDGQGNPYRGQYYTDILASKAVEMINQHNDDHPLFMYLAPTAPHAPMQAPPEYMAHCSHITTVNFRNILCGMMAGLDKMVGDVLAALESRDMLEDATIVYLSDNGGATVFGSDNNFRGTKGAVYEGGVRVPAFITGGRFKKQMVGATYDGLTHVTDLFATVARLGGVNENIISASDGLPMIKKNQKKMDKDFHRDVVYLGWSTPYFGSSAGVVFTHDNHYYKWTRFPSAVAYYAGYESAFVRGVTDGDFLYDLTTDPQETTNLVNDPAFASIVTLGQNLATANRDGGIQLPNTPLFLTEKPTAGKGCWLPRDSAHLDVDCGISVVNSLPTPPGAPFPFLASINQIIYQRAGLALQAANTAQQAALQQLVGATGVLLATDASPCTPARAEAKLATAQAMQALQAAVQLALTLTPGTPAYAQQAVVVQQALNNFLQKLGLYLAESSCNGAGLAPNVAAAQGQVVLKQSALMAAMAAFASAQANFIAEGQICGCACGVNCPPPPTMLAAASSDVSAAHLQHHYHVSEADVLAGRAFPNLYLD